MSEEQAVIVERQGGVMVITLNRPYAMNAINGALSNGLWNAILVLDAVDSLVAGVITGSGRAFCAGMDLKAFARGEDIGPLNTFVRSGANKPLIAAVNGFALAGGCEVMLTCDLIVAAKGAKIGIREVKVGLFAAAGGASVTRPGGIRQGHGDGINRRTHQRRGSHGCGLAQRADRTRRGPW